MQKPIQNRYAGYHKRPDPFFAAAGDAAFLQKEGKGKSHARNHPAHAAEVKNAVGIAIIVRHARHTAVECKHLLVQIVGDHQQKQYARHGDQKAGPFGQTVFLRLPQRQRNIHSQQRYKQHGQIIEIPNVPRHCQVGDKLIFQRAQNKPYQHQRRSQTQAVQCLLLYNAPVNGIAPQGKQQQIQRRADIVHPNAADVEHGQYPAGIGRRNDCKNQDHGDQLFRIPFHRGNLSLSPAIKEYLLAIVFVSRQDDSECAFTNRIYSENRNSRSCLS